MKPQQITLQQLTLTTMVESTMKEKSACYVVKRKTESAYGVEKKECAVEKGYLISVMDVMGTLVESIATSVQQRELLTTQVHKIELI